MIKTAQEAREEYIRRYYGKELSLTKSKIHKSIGLGSRSCILTEDEYNCTIERYLMDKGYKTTDLEDNNLMVTW